MTKPTLAPSPAPTAPPHDSREAALEAEPLDQLIERALDELQARQTPAAPEPAMQVAEVLDDRHPTLEDRVQIVGPSKSFGAAGDELDRPPRRAPCWVPVLRGLTVRRGDRVLTCRPLGWNEPVVVGVLDGLEPRSRTTTDAGRIELRADEVVSIEAADGRPLLEVHDSASGPVLRLASPDLTLDVPGALRLLADQLELRARDGGATIEARDDVEIRGEVIHLN